MDVIISSLGIAVTAFVAWKAKGLDLKSKDLEFRIAFLQDQIKILEERGLDLLDKVYNLGTASQQPVEISEHRPGQPSTISVESLNPIFGEIEGRCHRIVQLFSHIENINTYKGSFEDVGRHILAIRQSLTLFEEQIFLSELSERSKILVHSSTELSVYLQRMRPDNVGVRFCRSIKDIFVQEKRNGNPQYYSE